MAAVMIAMSCLIAGCEFKATPAHPRAVPPALPEVSTWKTAYRWDFPNARFQPGDYHFAEIMGAGCALFDYDNDGDLDVYLICGAGAKSAFNEVTAGEQNILLRQVSPGVFEDASAGSGLDVADVGMGVAIGDVNNDGWPDVFLANFGADRLLLNDQHGKFVDITAEAGIADLNWGTSACFVDYDRDGWLDLCVVNYLDYDPGQRCADAERVPDYCNPKLFTGVAPRLYRNVSGTGIGQGQPVTHPKFQDVSFESGIGQLKGAGLGVVSGDFNGDRWPDILIANDGAANILWINQKNGTFSEEGLLRSIAYDNQGRPQANMGIAVADPDQDGDPDAFITHLRGENNSLYINDPRLGFTEESSAKGLAAAGIPFTGFGTAFFDFELDGDLDLAIVNGDVRRPQLGMSDKSKRKQNPRPDSFWDQYAQRNQLFVNDGTEMFAEEEMFHERNVGRGLAMGDVDGDGDVDMLVSTADGISRLYLNETPRQGHWLLVKAVEPDLGGRDAYGAEIRVTAGKQSWTGWVNAGGSYLSSSDPRVHFGLGNVSSINSIRIIWPNGEEEQFPGGKVDQRITLSHGKGVKRE